jgi:TonB-linked SusC/RagA family outer membrane protein
VHLTASVASLTAKELQDKPTISVSQLLQGLTAGVTVMKQMGSPGNDIPIINIRGINTINPGENGPFCLIDGAPAYIETVNPADIESISILKDAAATAIYGTSAANGVVLINLKKGLPNKTQITFDTYVGTQYPTTMPQTVNAVDFMTLHNLHQKNNGLFPVFSKEYISHYSHYMGKTDLFPTTNWMEELVNPNFIHSQDVSISGGNSKLVYRFSAGNLSNKGIIPNTGFDRKSVRVNSTYTLNKLLSFNIGLSNLFTTNIQTSYFLPEIFKTAGLSSVLSNARLQNGTYGSGYLNNGSNALALAEAGGQDKNSGENAGVDLGFIFKPLKGLDFMFTYSYRSNNYYRTVFKGQYEWFNDNGTYGGIAPATNSFTSSYINSFANQYRFIVNYSNMIKKHYFSILAGFDNSDSHTRTLSAGRSNYFDNNMQQLDAGDIETATNRGKESVFSNISAISRINYAYDDKYLIEFNARNDKSSIFAPAYRNAFFPSFSVGWRINEERFMSELRNLSNLKIRASWGRTGRAVDPTGDSFPYMSKIDIVNQTVVLNEELQKGAVPTQWADESFTWEKTEMFNIGLDVGLFNGKLTGEFDLFDKRLTDGVYTKPMPLFSGLAAGYSNFVGMQNRGWELAVRWNDFIGKLKYSVGINFADVKNKITDMGGLATINSGSGNSISVGRELLAYYVYKSDGLITPEEVVDPNVPKISSKVVAGNVKLLDISGPDGTPDGKIDAQYDRYYTGTRFPRYQFSAPINLEWNGFDAYLFLQGVGKSTGLINRHSSLVNSTATQGNYLSWEKDTWDAETNPDGKVPALGGDNGGFSDYYMKSNAYIRLKTLTLGYSLPAKLIERLRMDKIRFYISGENILTFTNFYPGFDPEIPVNSNVFNYWSLG